MNSDEFVKIIKRHVGDAAIQDTIELLRNPPGRRVLPEQRARSMWYRNLSPIEEDHIKNIVNMAVHQALFGVLAAIDGDRNIDEQNGRFELFYINDERILLNDPNSAGLHDLLNAPD